MMKHRHLSSALLSSLLLAAAPLLSQCGGDAGLGTETGNPPRLDGKKLYLEYVADGLRVVGVPGALSPPGVAVRVTNLTTGASVEATAAADGSIDVVIAGALDDEIDVTITSGGQEASERLSFSAIGARTDLGGVSCQALETTLNQTLAAVFSAADAACATHVDCTSLGFGAAAPVGEPLPCYYECGAGFVSRAGAADVSTRGPEQTAAVCAALEGCDRPPPSSCPVYMYTFPVCRAGRCEGVDPTSVLCSDVVDVARESREQLRAGANKACTVDADCALADVWLSCSADCGPQVESVALSARASLEASVGGVVSDYCGAYFGRNCPTFDLSCPDPGVPEAFCDAGTCAVRYE